MKSTAVAMTHDLLVSMLAPSVCTLWARNPKAIVDFTIIVPPPERWLSRKILGKELTHHQAIGTQRGILALVRPVARVAEASRNTTLASRSVPPLSLRAKRSNLERVARDCRGRLRPRNDGEAEAGEKLKTNSNSDGLRRKKTPERFLLAA
jgi:hypothetical protein